MIFYVFSKAISGYPAGYLFIRPGIRLSTQISVYPPGYPVSGQNIMLPNPTLILCTVL